MIGGKKAFIKHKNELIKFIGINKTLYLSKIVKFNVKYLAGKNYFVGKR